MTPFPAADEPNAEAQSPTGTGKSHEPASMSLSSISGMSEGALGIENFDSDESSSGADFSKITQHSAFMVVLVAVAAAVVLGAMHLLQSRIKMPAFNSEATAKIEQAYLKVQSGYAIGSAGDQSTIEPIDHVLHTLTQQPQQIEIEYVQKNPFVMPHEKKTQQVVRDDAAERQRQEQRRKKLLMREARDYHIDMIMAGTEENAAVINGEVHKAGERLGSFLIESIDTQHVVLRAEKWRLRLSTGG